MKQLIILEELAMFLLSIYLFSGLSFAWWWYPAWILAPDIGMVGYAAGNKAGACTYNFFHHRAVAIAVYVAGLYTAGEALQFAGLILFGHAAMDRMLGYGLKTFQGFSFTHLGAIGRQQP